MGNSLACCGKSGSGDPNDVKLDDLSHYKGDKIQKIVHIQSTYRGHLARRQYKALREDLYGGIMPGISSGPPNYENPSVQVSTCSVRSIETEGRAGRLRLRR